MPDPIHGVNATNAVGVASTGQAGSVPAPIPPRPSGASNQADSADVARAQALIATITEAANMVPPANLTRIAELRQAIELGASGRSPDKKIVDRQAASPSSWKTPFMAAWMAS
jgi:hypothetical protein